MAFLLSELFSYLSSAMKKTYFVVLLLFASFSLICAAEDGSAFQLHLLPAKKIVPSFSTNARAHRTSIAKNFSSNVLTASFGGIFPLADVSLFNSKFQNSLGATVYNSLMNPENHLHVITTDFFVDWLFDVPITDLFIIRFGPGHSSQHLTDDAIEIYKEHSLNYAREYFQLFGYYKLNATNGFVYGGVYDNYSFKISSAVPNGYIFEFGGEAFSTRLNNQLFAYTGLDIKYRSEVNYGASQNYQIGIRYNGEAGNTTRIALNYQTGFEERGQYYNQKIDVINVGLYLEY